MKNEMTLSEILEFAESARKDADNATSNDPSALIVIELCAIVNLLAKQNEILRKTLEFYADMRSWRTEPYDWGCGNLNDTWILLDKGRRAQAALKQVEKMINDNSLRNS